ncbi:MAG: hypothetical protein C0609_09430, partial [Deltaproteobacteria bacterium]
THHIISLTLDPSSRSLRVSDTITRPQGEGEVSFLLHRGLSPEVEGGEVEELAQSEEDAPPWRAKYRVKLSDGAESFTVNYGGEIYHPPSSAGREYARGFKSTPGIISAEGAVLSFSTLWLPLFDRDELVTFELEATLPEGWDCVSQGRREAPEKNVIGWTSDAGQDDIWFVAAPFNRYELAEEGFTAEAYLRSPDEALANKYLDSTARYVKMYEGLIGTYPFSKFALVENFWETGFGMPSFTLLGPRVVRLPFILRTSYPHEILHNWWGNSVYIEYGSGNWAEGLTAYLADHLMSEQSGMGHSYRESTLQKYADYVAERQDSPLTSFVSRHSAASEALGYGKALMTFHMLRDLVGDKLFKKALEKFYSEMLWKRASWSDLQRVFSEVYGSDLGWFFHQWVERPGAPSIEIEEVKAADGAVSGVIRQRQGDLYDFDLKIAVTTGDDVLYQKVSVSGERTPFSIDVNGSPLRVDADPEFDLFRLLDSSETPPALSGLFGSKKLTFILPSGAGEELLDGYLALADKLSASVEGEAVTLLDSEVDGLPKDGSVWLMGWENLFREKFEAEAAPYALTLREEESDMGYATVPREGHSIVVTAKRSDDSASYIALLAADSTLPMEGLARKLPHYHKYSYLGFEGGEPVNIAKGRWPAVGSPLTHYFAQDAAIGKLPKRAPLATIPPLFSSKRMRESVELLSSPTFEGRGFGSEGLARASEYLAGQFKDAGLEPAGDDGFLQEFTESGAEGKKGAIKNVLGVIKGKDPKLKDEYVVVGAHYDHLGYGWPDVRSGNEGRLHPGADDNASGVAVLLELARYFTEAGSDRSILFAAFGGEEIDRAGSKYMLREGGFAGGKGIYAMVNVDTVGHLGDGKLLILGAGSAREWVHIFMGAGFVTGVSVESVSKDFGSSDQASFNAVGVPAVQLFTGANGDYHSVGDTADKLDYDGMVGVAQVAKEAVEYLAGRAEQLTVLLEGAGEPKSPTVGHSQVETERRRVSLGTVPDFAWEGEGVKVASVSEGSPAEMAGILSGDVIIALANKPVGDLKSLSEIMKALSVGEEVSLRWLRGEKEMSAVVRAAAR